MFNTTDSELSDHDDTRRKRRRHKVKHLLRKLRFQSKLKEIKFAKSGEMFRKYSPDSDWNTPQGRRLAAAASARRPSRIRRDYTYEKASQNFRRGAMRDAEIFSNLTGEHTDFLKKYKSLTSHYQSLKDAGQLEQAKKVIKGEGGVLDLRRKYRKEVEARKGYVMGLGTQRRNIRQNMANELRQNRDIIQSIRRTKGTVPGSLTDEQWANIKSNRPPKGIVVPTRGGHGLPKGVKPEPIPIEIGGEVLKGQDYKEVLTGLKSDVNQEVQRRIAHLTNRASQLDKAVRNRAAQTISASRKEGGRPPLPHAELQREVRQTVHPIYSAVPPDGIQRENIAYRLKKTPEQFDRTRARYEKLGVLRESDFGQSKIRKQVLKEGLTKGIRTPTPTPESFNYLKKIGKYAGIGAGIGTGALLLKKLRDRRKKDFSSKTTPRGALISFKKKDSTLAHDITVGSVEGGLGVLATDRLIRKYSPSTPLGKFGIGAGVGGITTASIGLGLNKIIRAMRRKREQQNMSAKSKPIEFKIHRVGKVGVYHNGSKLDIRALNRMVGDRAASFVSIKSLKPFPYQRRTGFSNKRMATTGYNPILVTSKGEVPDGRHRVAKKARAGETHVAAIRVTAKDLKAVKMRARANPIEFGRLYHRAAGLTFVGAPGQSKEEISKLLERIVLRQRGPTAIASGVAAFGRRTNAAARAAGDTEHFPETLGAARDYIRSQMPDRSILGTVATGRKGKRAYVSRAATRPGSSINVREVAHHEAFHNIPVVGQSEIAAHFVGGLRSEKGKLRPGYGLEEINHLRQSRPRRFYIEAGAIGAVGAGGAYAAKKIRDKRKRELCSASTPVQFDEGYNAPYPPGKKKRLTVAQDRYRKQIHERERDRIESNITKSAISGALVGSLVSKSPLKKAAAIGAGIGIASQTGVTIANRGNKDVYGERTWGAKRVERLPYQVGALAAGGIAARRLYKKLYKLSSKSPIIEFSMTPEERARRRFERRWQNPDAWPRRADDIYENSRRAGRLINDVNAKVQGRENLDERGRKRVPEWTKPWVKKGAIAVGLGAFFGGTRLLKGPVARGSAKLAEKFPRYAAAKKGAWDFYEGTRTDIQNLKKKFTTPTAAAEYKATAKAKAEKEAAKAAEEEALRKRLKGMTGHFRSKLKPIEFARGDQYRRLIAKALLVSKHTDHKPYLRRLATGGYSRQGFDFPVSLRGSVDARDDAANARGIYRDIKKRIRGLSSKSQPIQFAETVPDWDIRDQRGRSARIYAPGSQKRERRQKKWYERKDNQKLIVEAGLGTIGTGGVIGSILAYKRGIANAARPSAPMRETGHAGFKLVETEAEKAAKAALKPSWRKILKLNARLDDLINFKLNEEQIKDRNRAQYVMAGYGGAYLGHHLQHLLVGRRGGHIAGWGAGAATGLGVRKAIAGKVARLDKSGEQDKANLLGATPGLVSGVSGLGLSLANPSLLKAAKKAGTNYRQYKVNRMYKGPLTRMPAEEATRLRKKIKPVGPLPQW